MLAANLIAMNWKERMILLILAALNFTHILDFMIMMPLGNYLMPYFHIDTRQFSWLVAAYSVSAAVSGFGAAFFVDQYDRKKILLLGYSGFYWEPLPVDSPPIIFCCFLPGSLPAYSAD